MFTLHGLQSDTWLSSSLEVTTCRCSVVAEVCDIFPQRLGLIWWLKYVTLSLLIRLLLIVPSFPGVSICRPVSKHWDIPWSGGNWSQVEVAAFSLRVPSACARLVKKLRSTRMSQDSGGISLTLTQRATSSEDQFRSGVRSKCRSFSSSKIIDNLNSDDSVNISFNHQTRISKHCCWRPP